MDAVWLLIILGSLGASAWANFHGWDVILNPGQYNLKRESLRFFAGALAFFALLVVIRLLQGPSQGH